MLVFEDDVAEGVDRHQLLDPVLDGPDKVGSDVNQSDLVGLLERHGEKGHRLLHRVARARVLDVGLQIVHPVCSCGQAQSEVTERFWLPVPGKLSKMTRTPLWLPSTRRGKVRKNKNDAVDLIIVSESSSPPQSLAPISHNKRRH